MEPRSGRMGCIALILLIIHVISAVDRSNFKTCDQSTFCKRHRTQDKPVEYTVLSDTVKSNGTAVTCVLESTVNKLKMSLVSLADSTIRLVIDEDGTPLRPRYQPLDALKDAKNLRETEFKSVSVEPTETIMVTKDGAKVLLNHKPFRIDIIEKDEIVMTINSANKLKFEHFRAKDAGTEKEAGEGFWDETWKTHHDSKPYGSSSVGMDMSFIGYKYVFGLPEHASSFALRTTTLPGMDPYRLYNLDVFEFEMNSQMSLYGSVPFVSAINKKRSIGMLWLNAAETWVDVHSSTADKGMLASLVDKFKSSSEVPQTDVHFISESGLIDVFIMLGPSPSDMFRQNAALTGVYPLPPLFSIAYHQCRWNYNDQDDVAAVNAGFDEHDIPLDVIWLDIEHTDGKRYFTWDPVKFSKPLEMTQALAAKGRKLVTIIDPHIKKDDNFHVYKDAKDMGYFIKDKDGTSDYEGHCWPGASMYLDFINPAVRDYWASKFAFDKYLGSTEDTFTWNDMNEPSVFSGPEVTMHKDAKHYDGWEHRDIHNAYGFYHHSSTHKGLLDRSNGKVRPFILTRSFFTGSQRTTAVWTGDNAADWEHLRSSVPMLLSLSIAGIPHVGADVGGFFKNTDDQLLARWYQVGAFQPFFRAHAHIDCKRREPWLFEDKIKNVIRDAIRTRYSFLPYWYTLFYEHSITGKPVMRPLWAEFPEDENSYDEEREWLVGPGLLVRPVMEPDVTQTSLYLPGTRKTMWYEWTTNKPKPAPGAIYVDSPLEAIPLFQRGGTIIPTWTRIRRASTLMRQDPITLYIAADTKDHANGTIYMDDGESFEYKTGEYLYWAFTYKKVSDQLYTITAKNLDKKGTMETDMVVEKIIMRGVRYYPKNVHIYRDDWNPETLEFDHNRDDLSLVIHNPDAPVGAEFRVDIHT